MPSSSVKDPLLLRAIILEHYQHPKNRAEAPPKGGYAQLHNKSASCIDDFTVYLQVVDGRVGDARFLGIGCAISTAAASIATSAVVNKSVADAKQWLTNFARMINGQEHDEPLLGEAIAFCTISQLPQRIKCALAVPEPLLKLLAQVAPSHS